MVNPNQKIFPQDLAKFVVLVLVSIIFNYYAPILLKDLWYFFALYLYFKSKDEAFWLTYFLILNDGFASFFGYRGANIDIIPFLPQFEVGHLYVLIALYKTYINKSKASIFFSQYLLILFIYIIFLYIYGLIQGVPSEYNIHLRNIRNIFPLFLIYTTPKLLKTPGDFERFFSFQFLIAILAFLTQVFSIITGTNPILYLGLSEYVKFEVSETKVYREFYNVMATLFSFFAAMFYLAVRKNVFDRTYLYLILLVTMVTTFLSATRGWILGFGLSLLLYFTLVNRISVHRSLKYIIPIIFILLLGLLQPKIKQQIINATNRLMTVEKVLQGDFSAGGTASRATIQSPIVISKWREHPLIGWGFSDTFYKYNNSQVGNENILFQSGIIGALLLLIFFIYFNFKLSLIIKLLKTNNPYGRAFLVFPIFFVGMFIIHSTSGQLFGYFGVYYNVFDSAVFLGFGAVLYNHAKYLKKFLISSMHQNKVSI